MTKTQANTKQDSSLSVKTAQVGNQIAAFLVPDYMDGQKLAIVDEGVLKFLKSLLPKADFFTIKDQFIEELRDLHNLEDLVKHTKSFVAFHETVNLLRKYFDPNIKVTTEKPFNKEPEPLTLDEMFLKRELLEKEAKELDEMINAHPDYKSNYPQAVAQAK